MKVALAQINPTVGDFTGNLARIVDAAERASTRQADVVVFPELAVCGYPPADLLEKESFLDRAESSIAELARWTATAGRPALLCGSVRRSASSEGKRAENVAVLLDAGSQVFVQTKRLLPFYDVFDEQRYFEPATRQDLVDLRGHRLAITICEDAWNDKLFWPERRYAIDPVDELMQRWPKDGQPRIILNISASPYWKNKRGVREEMLGALARRHDATVVMVNQVGGNDSLIFDGSSLVLASDGQVAARARSFEEDLLVVDTESLSAKQAGGEADGVVRDEREEVAATWDALVLGTRDYLHKCGFTKALIGLSGGIDSALVAAIAVEALGAGNVSGIGMPSAYSSAGSIDDARHLATNLGIRFELLPIGDIVTQQMATLEPMFRGTEFGLAEENLQARVRGTLLMALSNKTGALVLTTGNKSEMSTGYCTLYGDMVGGLAVIADVWKTRVYALCAYANREREVIPQSTMEKPPSAELRPGQKDTDSLPPYDILDPILEAYVERYESAAEIAQAQGQERSLVEGILKLVERSEYKRQQAALVLKVTEKSFGLGRRFPIAVKVQV